MVFPGAEGPLEIEEPSLSIQPSAVAEQRETGQELTPRRGASHSIPGGGHLAAYRRAVLCRSRQDPRSAGRARPRPTFIAVSILRESLESSQLAIASPAEGGFDMDRRSSPREARACKGTALATSVETPTTLVPNVLLRRTGRYLLAGRHGDWTSVHCRQRPWHLRRCPGSR